MNPETTLKALSIVALAAALVACGSPVAPTPATSDTETTYAAPAEAEPLPEETPEPVAPARTPAPAPAPPRSAPATPPAPRPAPEARPAEQPRTPPPQPQPVTLVIPAGTQLDVSFLDSVSSAESQPGDPVRVRVMSDILQEGIAVVPAGSVVVGSVTEAVPLKKIGGRARVGVAFTRLELTSGRTASIHTTFSQEGKSETKKDAATIGGATAGGALLGRMIEDDDKSKGTLIGAVVGAAAGTAIAAKTDGEEIVITSGTRVSLQLLESATVTVTP